MKSKYIKPEMDIVDLRLVNGVLAGYDVNGGSAGTDDDHSATNSGFFDDENQDAISPQQPQLWDE